MYGNKQFNDIPVLATCTVKNDFVISNNEQLSYQFDRLTILDFASIYAIEFFLAPVAGFAADGTPLMLNVNQQSIYVSIVDKYNKAILDGEPIAMYVRANAYDIRRLEIPCKTEVDWQKSAIRFPNRAA